MISSPFTSPFFLAEADEELLPPTFEPDTFLEDGPLLLLRAVLDEEEGRWSCATHGTTSADALLMNSLPQKAHALPSLM